MRCFSFIFLCISYLTLAAAGSGNQELQSLKGIEASEWMPLSSNDDAWMRVKFDDNHLNVELSIINPTPIEVTPGTTIVFLSNDYKISQFHPTNNFKSSIGGGMIENGSNLLGICIMSEGNIDFFKTNDIAQIKIYLENRDLIINVSPQNALRIKNLCSQVLKDFDVKINKDGSTAPIQSAQYTLEYRKKRTNRNQWDIVKTETRKLTPTQLHEITEEWKSKSNEQYTYRCKVIKQ